MLYVVISSLFTVLCCLLQLSFSPCKMVVNQYVSQHLLKQPQNIDVICFSSRLTCFDSSVAYPFLVQGKDFLFFCFYFGAYTQDGEVRISVSVYFPERSMPCIVILTYYHHWSLKYRSSTLRVRLLGRGQKLRRHRRQKGSNSFVKACVQIQCWDSFHPVLLLQTSSFWMPPCLQGIRVV